MSLSHILYLRQFCSQQAIILAMTHFLGFIVFVFGRFNKNDLRVPK